MSHIVKRIVFTGDYSKLKEMGYGFQKLYANNYMQWSKAKCEFSDSVRVWKNGAEVTIDSLTNYEGYFLEAMLKMREENKPLPTPYNDAVYFIKNIKTREVFFSDEKVVEFRKQRNHLYEVMKTDDDELIKKTMEEEQLSDGFVEPFLIQEIIKLIDLGWVHVKTFKVTE